MLSDLCPGHALYGEIAHSPIAVLMTQFQVGRDTVMAQTLADSLLRNAKLLGCDPRPAPFDRLDDGWPLFCYNRGTWGCIVLYLTGR